MFIFITTDNVVDNINTPIASDKKPTFSDKRQFEVLSVSETKRSEVEAVEMDFIVRIRPYMKFFNLFGQSLYPLEYYFCEKIDDSLKWHRLAFKIPTVLIFSVNLVLCVASLVLLNFNPAIIRSYSVASNIYSFLELIKIFIMLHRNLVSYDLMGGILRNFQSVEILFQSTLQSPIPFTSFNHAYRKKLYWAFGSYAILVIFVASYYFPFNQITSSGVVLETMKFISVIVHMHVQFFIDLVTFYLKHLSAIIANEIKDRNADNGYVHVVGEKRTPNTTRKLLFKYKTIHFRLWKITEQLNQYFGWTVLLLTLQCFVHLINYSKWLMATVMSPWKAMKLISKYYFGSHRRKILLKIIFLEPLLNISVLAVWGITLFESCHNCRVEVKFKLR